MKGPGVRGLVAAVAAGVLLSFGPSVSSTAAARSSIDVPSQAPTTVPAAAGAAPGVDTDLPSSTEASVVGDPEADRAIRRIVYTLLGVAAGVLLITILFWRATRPVPLPLNRLSLMHGRTWRKADAAERDAILGRSPSPDGLAPEPAASEAVPADAAPAVEPASELAASDAAPAEEPASEPAASDAEPAEEPSGPGASLLADG